MLGNNIEINLETFTPYELVRWKKSGKLKLFTIPESKLWSDRKKSQLIESILAGIPLPPIYASEDAFGNIDIIDGANRLKSLFDFIDGTFKLNGLTMLPSFNEATYKDLPSYLRSKIENAKLIICVIMPGTSPDIIANIIKRINYRPTTINKKEVITFLQQNQK